MGRHDYSLRCRNVEKETNLQECEVIGAFPNWLNGDIIFNGPGLRKIGDTEFNHSFDGSAILQKFTIQNGKAFYCSKFLQSETFKRNKKAGNITVAEFGTPGPSSVGIMTRMISALDTEKMFSDNAPLKIVQMGSKYYVLGATSFILEFDPKTLNVINRVNMNKVCSIITQSPCIIEAQTGNYYSVGMVLGITGPKYAVVQYPKEGKPEEAKVVATLSCQIRMSPSWIHNVAITENYLIFIETPLAVSLMEVLSGLFRNKTFAEGLVWQGETRCVIRVIELKTSKEVSTKYITGPFFNYYFGNVYEELDHIVIDVCCFKDSSVMNQLSVKDLLEANTYKRDGFEQNFCSYLHRYILPINSSVRKLEEENFISLPNTSCTATRNGNEIHLTHEVLSNEPIISDPQSNSSITNNNKSNFYYVSSGTPLQEDCNYITLVKINVFSKERLFYYEEDLYPNYPFFIPQPGSFEEDDGVLVSLCLRSSNPHYAALVVNSAKTMKEICRAIINLETLASVPIDGIFIPNNETFH